MDPASTTKNQYHHAIPRFILRRYQVPVQTPVSPSRSRRGRDKRKPLPQENIYYYNLETCKVELRSIATVYGSTNLYKDVRNPKDVMEVEKKLSVLENNASRVISNIEKAVGVGQTVVLRRGDVEDLRRFLFVMHYRGENLSHEYFREDLNNPKNPWIKQYRQKFGLESPANMWLHVLRYYLDEPHEQMVAEFVNAMQKYGPRYGEMVIAGVDTSVKYEALAYGKQASSFFMSIWEAADGEEFLLGHNTFGLWEGLVMGEPEIHRIFVISPRIAIILRVRVVELMNIPRSDCSSILLDIPARPVDIQYHASFTADCADDMDKLVQYRRSAQARRDVFTFTKTKLSIAETDAFNAVVLCNLRSNGSLTFHSVPSTLRTLRKFMSAPTFRNYPIRQKFDRLIEALTYPSLLPSVLTMPPSSRRGPSTQAQSSNSTQPSAESNPPLSATSPGSSGTPAPLSQSSSDQHPLRNRLRELIYAELAGVSQFKSRYGAIYAIHKLCEHEAMPDSEFLSEQRSLATSASHHSENRFMHPPLGLQARPESLLVRDLSDIESKVFFEAFGTLFRTLMMGEGDDWLSRLSMHVAMVGFAERLAKTRPDLFELVTASLPMQLLR